MQEKINKLKDEFIENLKEQEVLEDLEVLYNKYLGRKGSLTQAFKAVKEVAAEERPTMGRLVNEVKGELENIFSATKAKMSGGDDVEDVKKEYDATIPGIDPGVGSLHPLTQIKEDLNDAFKFLGFEIYEGPEITSEGYAFDNLNFPDNHPARESMDTYWLKSQITNKQHDDDEDPSLKATKTGVQDRVAEGMDRLCLRPHLTGGSVRYMQIHKPPFRFVYPGRVFRSEATDAVHERCFYQYEALIVNSDITFSGGKILVKTILERIFGREVVVRMRSGFFPFVEPGFEIDMQCLQCGGSGCKACKGQGWLEMMPGGPPHPNVLRAGGIDPNKWQGFYINIGLDRLAMMKYGINDIRLFHSGDLRFLKQF